MIATIHSSRRLLLLLLLHRQQRKQHRKRILVVKRDRFKCRPLSLSLSLSCARTLISFSLYPFYSPFFLDRFFVSLSIYLFFPHFSLSIPISFLYMFCFLALVTSLSFCTQIDIVSFFFSSWVPGFSLSLFLSLLLSLPLYLSRRLCQIFHSTHYKYKDIGKKEDSVKQRRHECVTCQHMDISD